jgi:hypothetical protein
VLGYIVHCFKWISLWTESPQILRNPSSHLKILEARRVILSKFLFEGAQILGRGTRDFMPLISRAATRGWPQNILLANEGSHSCFLCCLVFRYRYSTLSELMYDDIWKEESCVIKRRDCTNISIILQEFLLQWGQWVFIILGLWPSTDWHTGTIFNVVQNIRRPPCKRRQGTPLKGWHICKNLHNIWPQNPGIHYPVPVPVWEKYSGNPFPKVTLR